MELLRAARQITPIHNRENIRNNDVELMDIEVTSDNEQILILNIYCHPNRRTSTQFYSDLMRFGESKGSIFVGDFNAHHAAWGCSSTDRAGRSLLNAVEGINGCIVHDERSTLLLPPNSGISVIDLIITTLNIAPLCEDALTASTDSFSNSLPRTRGRRTTS
ncbi:PREDICTED: uncharacterized protein LOC105155087 [Acromyrmex echinatior]|uniref:uncharacterized protein LOC105155087 n=1 Tax=Acromyrmex echinatior TaxID=103372 RepID=UPI000580D315|nr:PREDICTED: uncharacterized protein LOC105155087 [Acromyrmex echinatior]